MDNNAKISLKLVLQACKHVFLWSLSVIKYKLGLCNLFKIFIQELTIDQIG